MAPASPSQTSYWVVGRGGGKSFMLSLVAVYLAAFRDWSSRLAPGGKPCVLLLSPTRQQSQIALGYVTRILESSPILRKLIVGITANSVCVLVGCFERAPDLGTKYVAFVDPSGGGPDDHVLAIAHRKDERLILDCIRVRHGSPEAATAEFAETVKSYGISTISGDNYAKAWPQEAFRRHGVLYLRCAQPRSDVYLACAPLIRPGRVELLDHSKCVLQFTCLERKTSPSGRDQVNHPPGGHDDVCNAVAGALVLASVAAPEMAFCEPFVASRPRTQTIHDIPMIPAEPGSSIQPGISHGPEYGGGDFAQFWWPGKQ